MSETNGQEKKKKVGRPRFFDDDKKAQVIKMLESGGSRRMAANFVGCELSTLQKEMQRDPEFSDSLKEAEAKCYGYHVNKITKHGSWQASAWFLARKWPEEWAEVKKVAQTDMHGQDLSPHQRHKLIDAILAERKQLNDGAEGGQ